ncbi:hypothetical protein BAY61_32045 (plasmid) [Prauserella marina]|nr:hypothetical protein BAY61_32045 [Prauserella marina]
MSARDLRPRGMSILSLSVSVSPAPILRFQLHHVDAVGLEEQFSDLAYRETVFIVGGFVGCHDPTPPHGLTQVNAEVLTFFGKSRLRVGHEHVMAHAAASVSQHRVATTMEIALSAVAAIAAGPAP